MKTVGEYIYDASYQLNDQATGRAYTRWSRAQLLSYFNDGLAELSAFKPETLTAQINLTLTAGAKQTVGDTNKRLVSIDANADGSLVAEADLDLIKAIGPYNCCAVQVVSDAQGNLVYKARSYALDPKDTKVFYVSPEVPISMTPTVKATVVTAPKYTLADWAVEVPIDQKYQATLLDYIQGRAHDIDTESPMGRSNADKHLGRFYTIMGVKYRFESAYKAGNYNGSLGDGDPRAQV